GLSSRGGGCDATVRDCGGNMTLTVVNVAYPFAPVGPDSVGGAEQVLTQIDAALVRERHHSIVIACEGSASAGSLVATPRVEGPIAGPARESAHRTHRTAIERTLADERVDLLHLHGLDFHEYLPRIAGAESGVLTLVTLHLPPGWYSPRV